MQQQSLTTEAGSFWNTIPWEFTEIGVDKFSVDPRFQRHITYSIVNQIIRGFKDSAFGVIYANLRDNGVLSIIDGQHRIEAARIARGPEYKARTLLYKGLNVQQEALLFQWFNAARHRPTPLEIFKADLTARDPEAQSVAIIADEYEVEINIHNVYAINKPRTLTAIGTARYIYRSAGGDTLREVFDIILQAWGQENRSLTGRNLKAVYGFIRRYKGEYDKDRLVRALQASGMGPIERLGRTIGEEYGIMASTAMARAVAANYNKAGRTQLPEW